MASMARATIPSNEMCPSTPIAEARTRRINSRGKEAKHLDAMVETRQTSATMTTTMANMGLMRGTKFIRDARRQTAQAVRLPFILRSTFLILPLAQELMALARVKVYPLGAVYTLNENRTTAMHTPQPIQTIALPSLRPTRIRDICIRTGATKRRSS